MGQSYSDCALFAEPRAHSEASYIDHLLYSAELMLETETGWDSVSVAHADCLCTDGAPSGDTDAMTKLLKTFRATACMPSIGGL